MTAKELKDRLYARHFASAAQMPGPWTVIEEWRGIDVVAFSAWHSAQRYARVGYEVKVSRGDMRSELLNPGKRQRNVEWCNEFYFAVPAEMLTAEELAYQEPGWTGGDWRGERCSGFGGVQCHRASRRRTTHVVRVPIPTSDSWGERWTTIRCPTCGGKGMTTPCRVELEAPTLWVPRDVGLVVADGRGTRLIRKSPQRADVPTLTANELGMLVRWVSMRPDPRHHPQRLEAIAV